MVVYSQTSPKFPSGSQGILSEISEQTTRSDLPKARVFSKVPLTETEEWRSRRSVSWATCHSTALWPSPETGCPVVLTPIQPGCWKPNDHLLSQLSQTADCEVQWPQAQGKELSYRPTQCPQQSYFTPAAHLPWRAPRWKAPPTGPLAYSKSQISLEGIWTAKFTLKV